MPELIQIGKIRRRLEQSTINKKIVSFRVSDLELLRGQPEFFKSKIQGSYIKRVNRRGKYLIFKLASGYYLFVYLHMTGQFVYQKGKQLFIGGYNPNTAYQPINKYSRAAFKFEDNSKLFFNDMRRLGHFEILSDKQRKRFLVNFGIEPLAKNFSLNKFIQLLRNKSSAIKNILINKKYIVGIGSQYADEICFNSRVRPDKGVKFLSQAEVKRLYASMRKVLRKASQSRIDNFQLFKVYNRQGQHCLRCKLGKIEQIKINQRKTYYCPLCQN